MTAAAASNLAAAVRMTAGRSIVQQIDDREAELSPIVMNNHAMHTCNIRYL